MTGKRCDNGDVAEASFTIEEAQRAGLANRDVWKKYTQDMLYARAMSRLSRRLFPDVIGEAYVQGELSDPETINITPDLREQPAMSIEEAPLVIDQKLIDVEEGRLLNSFIAQYPDEKTEDIELFFGILKDAWKKPYSYILEKYRDHELFMKDFGKWKAKQVRE